MLLDKGTQICLYRFVFVSLCFESKLAINYTAMLKRFYGFALVITSLSFQACDNHETALDGNSANRLPDEVSFNFHIRPILSDNCFACHGPDANKREASLRLDIEEEAFRSLENTPDAHALVPGDPQASEVYNRVLSDDPSLKMPPPDSNLKLTDFEINLIKKWISQGQNTNRIGLFYPLRKLKSLK